jgi:RNase adaptor protein for sRNA GlmZ degradation
LRRSYELSSLTYQVMFRLMAEFLGVGEALLVEGNFTRGEHTRMFLDLKREHPYQPYQVLCYAPGETLLERFKRRRRHPGHLDDLLYHEIESELMKGRCEPLQIGGSLVEVDTSNFGSIDIARLTERLIREM